MHFTNKEPMTIEEKQSALYERFMEYFKAHPTGELFTYRESQFIDFKRDAGKAFEKNLRKMYPDLAARNIVPQYREDFGYFPGQPFIHECPGNLLQFLFHCENTGVKLKLVFPPKGDKRITRKAVAEKADIAVEFFSRFRKNKTITLYVFWKICSILGIKLSIEYEEKEENTLVL